MEKGRKEKEKKEGNEGIGRKEKGKKLKTQRELKAAGILDVLIIYMRNYHGNTRIT